MLKTKPIKIKPTERGFARGEFVDLYGVKCSIQESSLATERCIWLGVNDSDPVVNNGQGWKAVELPCGTVCKTRMHLTQDMVKQLLPLLKKFARTGGL